MTDYTKPAQIQAEIDLWRRKARTYIILKPICLLIFYVLIPAGMLWVFTDYNLPNVSLLVLPASIACGFFLRRKMARQFNPIDQRAIEHLHRMHSELLKEVFETPVDIKKDILKKPEFYEPGMKTHIFRIANCSRGYKYTITDYIEFNYRKSMVRLCSLYVKEDVPADDYPRHFAGLYLAVHTGISMNLPHDPLNIYWQPDKNSVGRESFENCYKGVRKAGSFGHREKIDSMPVIPQTIRDAIWDIRGEKTYHGIAEAWITAMGDYYYRIEGADMRSLIHENYDLTEEKFRELYKCIRMLIDAGIDMAESRKNP